MKILQTVRKIVSGTEQYTSDVIKELDKNGNEIVRVIYKIPLSIRMNKNQALYIKFLRIRCEGTWRWVAGKYDDRYVLHIPFNDYSTGGNQLEGMELCHKAMCILHETPELGWN